MLAPKNIDGKMVMACPKCGTGIKELTDANKVVSQEIKHDKVEEEMVVIENPDALNTMPIKVMHCPKCKKNLDAQWWTVQTRSGDEAPTRFYRCTKCKHTWREYD